MIQTELIDEKSRAKKKELLKTPVEHIDIRSHNVASLIHAYGKMSFQARNLHRAAQIYEKMLKDSQCGIILCLAGSLVSSGLRKVLTTMIEENMIDAIVSTGANIVDQDFFEALGYRHYIGSQYVDDHQLRELAIDRIYDTYIDEEELRACDETVGRIADSLPPRPYSSREFLVEMAKFLIDQKKGQDSIVRLAFEKGVPIFCPAFSDCSAGFGLVHHQWHNKDRHVSIDAAKDFLELTKLKLAVKETGLLMIGGGVPKNFAQDIVVSAEVLGFEAAMHKYAVQITVADERDGALSGSTLKEACSWGKVDTVFEQMVFGEATALLPLLVSYAYHSKAHLGRKPRSLLHYI